MCVVPNAGHVCICFCLCAIFILMRKFLWPFETVSKAPKATDIPSAAVQRILRHHLNLYPYQLQLLQELNEVDKEKRLHFGLWLQQNEHRLPFIFWSDEANLHLNGDISRHHCRIWSRNKPQEFLTKPLHALKVSVWLVSHHISVLLRTFLTKQ